MTRANIQLSGQEEVTRAIFDRGMAYLEASKQEKFSRETLEVWWNEVQRLKWTREKFRERILAVLQMPTYGKISFDMFLNAEPVVVRKTKAKICLIHDGEEYQGDHCPKCWSPKPVPIPPDVMKAIRELGEQMEAKDKKG